MYDAGPEVFPSPRVLQPAPTKNNCKSRLRASFLCDHRDGKLPSTSKTYESQGERGTEKSNPSDYWRFDIATSIPSEDRGTRSIPVTSRYPRNSPPSQASRLDKRGGAGGITHNTWDYKTRNHRGGVGKDNPQHREPQGPFPFPPLRHTDDIDGDDVVHNDVDVLFPEWLLVVPFLLCCSVENRAWLVMFLRKLYRPLSFQAEFRLVHVRLSTCLNDFIRDS